MLNADEQCEGENYKPHYQITAIQNFTITITVRPERMQQKIQYSKLTILWHSAATKFKILQVTYSLNLWLCIQLCVYVHTSFDSCGLSGLVPAVILARFSEWFAIASCSYGKENE